MASSLKNLNDYTKVTKTDLSAKRVVLVVSTYYSEIISALESAAIATLMEGGILQGNIHRREVPGTFELTLGAQWVAQLDDVDAVICLGCVIQGETKHFDFICQAVASGITDVGMKYNKPVIFGVLTPNNYQQALDRAGGVHGNKGVEAAAAALAMLQFHD
jgi:6,7-dimethyl-8-ribityllumazine synthase